MNNKTISKRLIFRRCIAMLMVICLIPIGDFAGVSQAYAQESENGLNKNITLNAKFNNSGNVELEWDNDETVDHYVINKNGEDLTTINNTVTNSNDKHIYVDKDIKAATEYVYIIVAYDSVGNNIGTCQAVTVKAPETLVVSSNYTLDRNMTVYSLKINSNTLNLNGYSLTVCKDIEHYGGTLNFNEGEIKCYGNYTNKSSAVINMSKANDKMLVYGNMTWESSSTSTVTNGIIEIRKNLTFNSNARFNPSNYNKVLLSGSDKQIISTNSNITFNKLEIKNTSDEGVYSILPLKYVELITKKEDDEDENAEYKLVISDESGVKGETLDKDKTIDGDYVINRGTLDLKGHKLTIKGDLIHIAGDIKVNGGELIVEGDYRAQSRRKEETEESTEEKPVYKTVYDVSIGNLIMTNEEDKVTIKGNYINNVFIDTRSSLTNGVMEVKGDFTIIKNGNGYSFHGTDNHTVKFTGDKKQILTTLVSGQRAYMVNVIFANTSDEGIVLSGDMSISKSVDDTDNSKITGWISPYVGTTFADNTYSSNVYVPSGYVFDKELHVKGEVNIYGNATFNSNVTIDGNIECNSSANIVINDAKLTVGGDFNYKPSTSSYSKYLSLNNENAYLLVKGNFTFDGYYTSNFSKGTIEVKKDVKIVDAFSASAPHKLLLSGDTKQTLTVGSNVTLGILEIDNDGEHGVVATSLINKDSLVLNDSKFAYESMEGTLGWTLEEDEVYEGDLTLLDGVLDLNGHKLTVTGRLNQVGADIHVNGGELIVKKDYISGQINTDSDGNENYKVGTGRLIMTNSDDKVKVGGMFYFNSKISDKNILTEGVLEVKKDVILCSDLAYFFAEYNHTLKLNGNDSQTLQIAGSNYNVTIANLEVTNTSEGGIKYVNTPRVYGNITDNSINNEGNISIYASTKSSNNVYKMNINIDANITINDETTFNKNLNVGNYVTIANNVVVKGNYSQTNGALIMNKHRLTVEGNFSMNGGSSRGITMNNEDDYIYVEGDFTYKPYYTNYNNITKGVIEVKGNVYSTDLYAKEDNTFILSGSKKQTIEISSGCKFATLVLANTSEDGVYSPTLITKDELVRNDCKIQYGDLEGEVGWTLSKDTVYDGDLVMIDDVLDLNGYTLTVKGDMVITAGELKVNGGKLIVENDLRMQGRAKEDDGTYNYSNGMSRLIMTNSEDEVIVKGDFYQYSTLSGDGYMTEGRLEVEGNITVAYTANDNFFPTNNHTLVLNGDKKQTINFVTSGRYYSQIRNVEFNNSSSDGIVINNAVPFISGIVTQKENVKVTGYIGVGNGTEFEDDKYVGNVQICWDHNINNDLYIDGDVEIRAQVRINNKLTVSGNVTEGNNGKIVMNNGYLEVLKNLTINAGGSYGINMTNKDDYILVHGNLDYSPAQGTYYYEMSNGVIEIKGNFTSTKNLKATDKHKFLLSGDKLQTISLYAGAKIATLELQNYSEEGVYSEKILNKDKLIRNDCKLTYGVSESVIGWKLETDYTCEGDMLLIDDTIDLNGFTLTIRGDLIHAAGNININNGKLIVLGDYIMSNRTGTEGNYKYNTSTGKLSMIDKDDVIEVHGNYKIQVNDEKQVNITNGNIYLFGNIESSISLKIVDNAKLIMQGVETQTMGLYNYSTIATLINNNEKELNIKNPVYITKSAKDAKNTVAGNNIVIVNANIIEDGTWSGSVEITSTSSLTNQLVISNNLILSGELHVNDEYLYAKNITVNSRLYTDTGSIVCTEDMTIEKNGILYMIDEKASVLVGDAFTMNSSYNHQGMLTAGTLEVRGHFNQNSYTNFRATDKHTTVLGKKKTTSGSTYIQTIRFNNLLEGSTKFNKLVLKKADNKYQFSHDVDILCNELVRDIEDDSAPTPITSIKVKSYNETTVVIEYEGATDDSEINGYEIYRNGKKIGTTSSTTYTDKGLDTESRYTYEVYPFDEYSNIATESPSVSVTTLKDTSAPNKPENVEVATRTGSSITIRWDKPNDNVETKGYRVYRNDELIVDQWSDTEYKDNELKENTIYAYKIEAYDKAGNYSEASDVVEATVAMPRILSITPKDGSELGGTTATLRVEYENVGNSKGNTLRIEYLGNNNQWIKIPTSDLGQNDSQNSEVLSFVYNWGIKGLSGDKEYIVRYTLTDADGNQDIEERIYTVDKQAPALPEDFKVISEDGVAKLSWKASVSSDCKEYRLYLYDEAADKYEEIKVIDDRYTENYIYKDVEVGQEYVFAIKAKDNSGNISDYSDKKVVVIEKDEECPTIEEITPEGGSVNKETVLDITAKDNKEVVGIKLEISKKGSDVWQLLDTCDTEGNNKISYKWDTNAYDDGEYEIRAYAIDSSDNVSENPYKRTYTIDNTSITKVKITSTKASENSVQIAWSNIEAEDYGYCSVEQKEKGEFKEIARVTKYLGYTIGQLCSNTEYTFRVVPYDKLGNRGEASDEINIKTEEDKIKPRINKVLPIISSYSKELKLEMNVSDNSGIDYGVFSYSYDNKTYEDIAIVKDDNKSLSTTLKTTLNLGDIQEGKLYIKFIVYDIYGNVNEKMGDDSEIIATYTIDKTAPSTVKNIVVTDTEGCVGLSWDAIDDVQKYRIYKSVNNDGMYKIHGEITSTKYYDNDVEPGETYTYKIVAIDVAGNIGKESREIAITVNPDVNAPSVKGINPATDTIIGLNTKLTVAALDNARLKNIVLEYRPSGSKDDIWNTIKEIEVSSSEYIGDITWNIKNVKETKYDVRAYAKDKADNRSEYKYVTYNIDNIAPKKADITATSGDYQVTVNIGETSDNDIGRYEIYRKKLSESDSAYKKIQTTTKRKYVDKDVLTNTMYCYKVIIYDKVGNHTTTDVAKAYAKENDTIAPVASLPKVMTGIEGMELQFDGLESSDNVRITEYKWKMGDGKTVYGKRHKYTYDKAGTYVVTLEVKDGAGNKDSVNTTVEIKEKSNNGKTTVRITDDSGNAIPYAAVCIMSDSISNKTYKADYNGYVDIYEKAGNYTLAAYKAGYIPDEMNIEVSTYNDKNYTLKLSSGDVVVGEITTKKLTLVEMIEAGVDFDSAINNHIFEFEITLMFEKCPLPIKVKADSKSETITKEQIVNAYKEIDIGFGGKYEESGDLPLNIHFQEIKRENEGEEPVYGILTDRQTVSWLKDMYSVDLQIVNMADTQYEIIDSSAILELQEGLSLAALEDKEQVQYVDFGTIKGGESKKASWIVTGDKAGEYTVKALFEGYMMPFNEVVRGEFYSTEKIEVPAGEGLVIYAEVEEAAYIGKSYRINYTIKNESSRTFYNLKTSIGESIKGGEITEKVLVNPVTGETENIEIDEKASEIVQGSNKCKNVMIETSGKQVVIPAFNPGDEITGTSILDTSNLTGDPEKEFYKLVKSHVEVLQGKDLGVKVVIKTVPSHITKFRQNETVYNMMMGDPIDLSTGAFIDEYTALSVTKGSTLDYTLNYNSIGGDVNTSLGYGWYSNFDTRIEEKNGQILFYNTPFTYAIFENKDLVDGNIIYGTKQGDSIVIDTSYKPEIATYVSKAYGMDGYKIERAKDGTYTVTSPDTATLKYDNEGRLISMTYSNGRKMTLTHTDSQTIINDTTAGTRIKVNYNEAGLVTSVEDDYGRSSTFAYTGELLTSVTNPELETTKYVYDEANRIIEEISPEGVSYVSNTYDEEGRVTRQNNGSTAEVINISYGTDEETGYKVITSTDEEGYSTVITMDHKCRIVQTKNSRGGITKNTYDEEGNNTSITDAKGNKTTYTYDKNGNILTQTEPNGATIKYTYDNNNNISSIIDSLGNKATFVYNDKDKLTKLVDFDGKETTYTYNSAGQVTSETVKGVGTKKYSYSDGLLTETIDAKGNKSTMTYDNYGNMTSVTDPLGNKTSYSYDKVGRVVSETDANGNSITHTYNSFGMPLTETSKQGSISTYSYDNNMRPTKLTLADGTSVKYEYNKKGDVTKETYADGTSKKFEYDSVGNITKKTFQDGSTVSYTYDILNQVISEVSQSGRSIKYEHDSVGNLTKVTYSDGTYYTYKYNTNNLVTEVADKEGNVTKYAYDKSGRVIKVTDALGNVTTTEYDTAGNVSKTTDAKGNSYEYTYDANGNCTKVKDPLGQEINYGYDELNRNTAVAIEKDDKYITAAYVYDKLGRVSKVIDEVGNETTMTYDANGNLLKVTDALGNVTETNEYNEVNQLTKTTDALGNITSLEYDSIGNVIKTVNYLNTEAESKYEYSYDKLGNLTKTVDPLEGISKYEYDLDGNVVKQIDPNGGETVYTYDTMGKVTSEVNAIGSKKTYTYNALGLLASMENARNQKAEYEYDALGRITKVTDEIGETSYNYDENGNVLKVTEKTSDGDTKVTERTYDKLNRVKTYTDYKGNTVKYSYDQIGNLINLTYPGGEIVRYEYYDNGYLHKVIEGQNVTTYEYDKVGNLTKTTRSNGTVETREYDKGYRLLKQVEKDKEGKQLSSLTYTYDKKGNITKTEGYKETEDDIDKLTSATMKYDKANRLIEYNGKEVKYDADGNMIYGPVDGEMTDLKYDCRNRLVKAGKISYEYDAEGNRIATVTDTYREEYILDTVSTLPQVLVINRYEIKDDKVIEEASFTTTLYYGNGLVYERQKDEQGNTVYYHHYNNIGSTILLTNTGGKIVEEYAYGTYGELLSGDVDKTRFLYNGKYGVQTEANGLLYMRSRYYNPEIKRFINQDILLGSIANSQSLNRYSYVQGNPVSLIDPFGTRPLTAKEEAVHAILGLLGVIPVFGAVPDLLNAFIYIDQGHYGSAVISLACALSTLGDAAFKSAKLVNSGSDLAKVISEVRRYAKTIEGLDSVLSGLDNIYTDHIVNGEEISGKTIWNMIAITAGLGEIVGANMSAQQKQALYDAIAGAKDGADKAAKKFLENIKKEASEIHNNNGGFFDPNWNKVDDVVEGILEIDSSDLKSRYRDHIFSDKHIEKGIMDLGKNEADIMDSGFNIIREMNEKGMIKEGATQIKTHINGYEAEIRIYVMDGRIRSFDMFKEWSARDMGNTLYYH